MKENNNKTCCFAGHRDLPVGDRLEKLQKVLEGRIINLIERGFMTFIAGGALGFDMLAACTVLRMKEKYPYIRLKLALPHEGSSLLWRYDSRVVQNLIITHADEIVLVSKEYFGGCMLKRNRYMVKESDYCIIYLNKNSGGTFYTLNEAKRKGIGIINICEFL